MYQMVSVIFGFHHQLIPVFFLSGRSAFGVVSFKEKRPFCELYSFNIHLPDFKELFFDLTLF